MPQTQIDQIRLSMQRDLLREPAIRFLVIGGVLVVATIAIGVALVVSHYRSAALADSERELNNTVKILAEQIDRTFQSLDLIQSGVVKAIEPLAAASSNNYARLASSHDVHIMLKDKASGLFPVDNISIIGPDGNLLNYSRDWPVAAINVADRDYFRALQTDASLTSLISRPIQARSSGMWSVFFERKVTAPNGEFRGAVSGTIEISYFESLFGSLVLGENSSITLYRNDGIVLARFPHKEAATGQVFQPVIDLLEKSNNGTIRFKSQFGAEGRDRMLAAHRVSHYPLYVSAALDVESALADWRRQTEILLVSALLVVLTITFMCFQVVQLILDIHSRSKKTLLFEKQRFSAAIDNMSQGLIMFDAAERMIVCNNRFLEMYGLSAEVVMPGCTFREVIAHRKATGSFTGNVDEYCSARLTGIAGQKPYEYQPESEQGRTIRIVSRPVLAGGWLTTHEDITDERRREQSIRLLFIDNPVPMWVYDRESLRFLAINDAAVALYGYHREQFLTMRVPDLSTTQSEEFEAFLRALPDVQDGEQVRHHQKADGSKLHVEAYSRIMKYEDRDARLVAVHNVTDRITAEDELRYAQKMESVGQLTGGIAHDFNNMLTVITGTIDILGDAVSDRPQLAAIAKLISDAADRGAELTGRLLAFARKQPLQPCETDVNSLMTEWSKLLRPALGEHVEYKLYLEETVWPALIDPGQLTMALLNLAVNARDAMPDGGKLTPETSNIVLDQKYGGANGNIEPGSYVLIAVSDTGSGMPEEVRQRAFEPFYTTKEVGKGTGLGLSMVYGFVKQSGGHINIYSEEGHGTTFKIYLPRGHALPVQVTEPMQVSQIGGGTETILVVEDEALLRTSVITQIQSLGYKTLSAVNGPEALAIVDRGEVFDLLFTDMIMPGKLNGRQLAEEVAKRRPSLKVLFTSGYTEGAVIHHGRLDSGILLLTKPYRKQDLARMLRRAIERADVPSSSDPGPTTASAI